MKSDITEKHNNIIKNTDIEVGERVMVPEVVFDLSRTFEVTMASLKKGEFHIRQDANTPSAFRIDISSKIIRVSRDGDAAIHTLSEI